MLAQGLSIRYDFGGETAGDALVRRTAGKRIEDGRSVCLVVFEDAAGIGQEQGIKAVETAGALAALGLPSVLACLEAGRDDDGRVFMVFEASDMPTLKSVIRERGGLSPAEALGVAHSLAWTLARAADAGIHHLDITSSSIHCNILDGGPLRVRIAGFGLASILPSYNPMKKAAPYFGNAEYMAPEICAGRPGSVSADLYAIGILLYEMVTGKPPFVSAGASTTIKRQVYEKPLPLHLVKPGLQQLDSFEALVTRLLAKDPTGRPVSAAELVDAIEKLKAEAFPDMDIQVEPRREDCPVVVSTFATALPQPVQVSGAPGETMAFEGLSEAVARMIEAQESAKDAAPKAEPEAGVKTEAFDASFIAAVVEQAAAGGDLGAAISDAKTRMAQGEEAAPAGQVPEKPTPAVQSARKPKATKKVPKAKLEKAPEPAVKSSPTKQTQSVMKKPAKGSGKGGAVVVVVVIALAVLLAIGAAFWWKNRAPAPADQNRPQDSAVSVAADQERQIAEARAVQAMEKVRLGRMMLDKGDLVGAEAAVAEALRILKDMPAALKLRDDIAAARQAETPVPAEPAPAPAPAAAPQASDVPVVYKPAAREPSQAQAPAPAPEQQRPAPIRPKRSKTLKNDAAAIKAAADGTPAAGQAPAPAPEPAADPKTEANALRAKARKAYKSGDCATAVSLLEQVRALGQFNDLDAGVMKKCATKTE